MESKCDVVFIYMNLINNCISGAEYQLECAYARCYIHKFGLKSMQYINKNTSKYKDIVNDLIMLDAVNYIFYINEYNYYITKLIINNLNIEKSNSIIYVMGPSAKFISQNLLNEISVDICIMASYPTTLAEILVFKNPLNKIKNIAYKKNNNIITNEISYDDLSLDEIGLPYSDGMIPPEEVQNVGLITSTGCYGNCLFCSYNSLPNIFKMHSIGNVIKELAYISEYISGKNVRINFFDDCFSINNERSLELCNEIVKEKLEFEFWCCTRSDLLSEKLLDKMAECNFKNIVIGLETASINVMEKLGKIRKTDTPEHYIQNLISMFVYAKNENINPNISVNFGLPNEKYFDAMETIHFISNNDLKNSISICFTTCFPGSKMFDQSNELHIHKEPSPTVLPYRTYYKEYEMTKICNTLVDAGILNSYAYENYFYTNKFTKEFTSFFTGVNSEGNVFEGIKQIIVDKIDEGNLSFIDQNIDLNGRIIISPNKIKISNKYLFSDDRKRLKLAFEEYDSNLRLAYKKDKYIPNQAFIRTSENKIVIQPDNMYRRQPLNIPMKRIDIIDDLNDLIKKSEKFYETGFVFASDVNDYSFENSCTFTGCCNVYSQPRFKIEGDCIHCCINRQGIGKINDSYEDIMQRINTKSLSEFKKRNCQECKLNKLCSKCIFPPSYMGDDLDFCKFIKSNYKLLIYLRVLAILNKMNIEKMIPDNIPINIYLKSNNNSEAKIGLKDNSMMVIIREEAYISSLESMSIIKCNKEEKVFSLSLFGLNDRHIDSLDLSESLICKFKILDIIE